MTIIACSQYQIENLPNWQSYTDKIKSLVAQAKQAGAELLMLPEYVGIEIACQKFSDDPALFAALQSLLPQYIQFFQELAQTQKIYIQAGTILEQVAPNQYVNRAYFFSPNGSYGFQDKLQLTEFEKSLKVLQHGQSLNLFSTSFAKIGIAICYDSEFPEIVRALVEAGAQLILVPSYTTTVAGYNRVWLSCRARALENQCYVAVSYVVNLVDVAGEAENTFGQAAIVGPVDIGFPDDGVLASGKMNAISIITANISFEKMASVRKKGQVHNFEDAKRCELIRQQELKIIQL